MVRWSAQFLPIDHSTAITETAVDSRRLLLRAGYIREIAPGSYALLPMAQQVRMKIKEIIRQAIIRIGAQELHLPLVVPTEEANAPFDPLRHAGSMGEILAIARDTITSTSQLPQRWFHIGPVAGGSGRSSAGLLRMREEMMFEGFSIDRDRPGIDEASEDFLAAFTSILSCCGVDCLTAEVSVAQSKGRPTTLIVAPVENGDRIVAHCGSCGYTVPLAGDPYAVEPGGMLAEEHTGQCVLCGGATALTRTVEIARLGQVDPRHEAFTITTPKGTRKSLAVGSYRIAIDRLTAIVVEQWSDERGLVWPASISPVRVIVTPVVQGDRLVTSASERLCSLLAANGFPVLLDDRELDPATKFADADLIGIPWRITMGNLTREGRVEITSRATGRSEEVVLDDIIDRLGQLMD